MHILKSLSRDKNRLHGEFANAVHSIYTINITSGSDSEDVSVVVQMRSFTDVEAKDYSPIREDGRQIDQKQYSIPYSELEFQSLSRNPIEELKRASLVWLVANNSDYINGTVVE